MYFYFVQFVRANGRHFCYKYIKAMDDNDARNVAQRLIDEKASMYYYDTKRGTVDVPAPLGSRVGFVIKRELVPERNDEGLDEIPF